MTGVPEFNIPMFHAAAKRLCETGFSVINPAEEDDLKGVDKSTMGWVGYMRRDIRMLMDCDGIALLPGWWKSPGAKLELYVARTLGMDVLDAESGDPIPRALQDTILANYEGREGAGPWNQETILDEAARIVDGPRQHDYGSPVLNHGRTAAMWSVLFGVPITAEQVCWANILQKAARCMNTNTRDGLVDVAGYARNLELIMRERES
jgi:hypothetical protein